MRYTVAEFKIECFQKSITKKVTFDHSKIFDWFIAYRKLHSASQNSITESFVKMRGSKHLRCAHCFQFKKLWRELISDVASCIRIDAADIITAICILIDYVILFDTSFGKLLTGRFRYFEQHSSTF